MFSKPCVPSNCSELGERLLGGTTSAHNVGGSPPLRRSSVPARNGSSLWRGGYERHRLGFPPIFWRALVYDADPRFRTGAALQRGKWDGWSRNTMGRFGFRERPGFSIFEARCVSRQESRKFTPADSRPAFLWIAAESCGRRPGGTEPGTDATYYARCDERHSGIHGSGTSAREPDVDAAANVYGLGCVACFLLTGMLVFEEPTPMATAWPMSKRLRCHPRSGRNWPSQLRWSVW